MINHTTIKKESHDREKADTILVVNASKKKVEKQPERQKEVVSDTLLIVEEKPEDSIPVDTISAVAEDVDAEDIVTDRLLGKKTVLLQNFPVSGDTTASGKLAEKVGETTYFNKKMMVEFWESPIDFMGYRLNKTTLVLYGISPQESFELIYQNKNTLLFQTEETTIPMMKTEKYTSISF
ncbi:hypothetical protein GCM10009118_18270 [Wandonia haliotis]|uniref:Uncharacterized protein n=1 Tax=Wandonia haliotis TaxID=574963 RepID=A0ABN1MQB5_9FLAO